MAERPPRVILPPDREDPGRPPRRRGGGIAMPVAALVGLAIGIAVLIVVVAATRGGNSQPAETVVPEVPEPPLELLRIVFPEGFTIEEMAERVTAVNGIAKEHRGITPSLSASAYRQVAQNTSLIPEGFLATYENPPTLEGFLFPATYQFTEETTTRELIEQQIAQFERTWAQLDLSFAERQALTAYDVLIIASMIEEEVREPRERELAAAVIYNRLNAGMTLGIDSTVRYGLGIPATESLRRSQLQSDNPYNTRKLLGLPPTPISNPGLESMRAAAQPADKPFLFYARRKDCQTHFFTESEAKFLAFLDGPNSFRQGPNRCA